MVKMKASSVLLVLSFVLELRAEKNVIFKEEVNGNYFSKVTTVLPVKGFVYYIDYDQFIPGNLIFATDYQLFTVNIERQTKSLITGGGYKDGSGGGYKEGNVTHSKFSSIYAFHQLTKSSLLIVDGFNDVLRKVNRVNGESSLFAGTPQEYGLTNGTLITCQFIVPTAVATFDGLVFYISQLATPPHLAIMDLNTFEESVIHLKIEAGLNTVFADIHSGKLLATGLNTVYQINPSNVSHFHPIAGSGADYTDGPINLAKFHELTYSIPLSQDTLLATEFSSSGSIRVIDLNGNVSSICSGSGNGQHISNCTLTFPTCIMRYNSSLILVGTNGSIAGLFIHTTLKPQANPINAGTVKTLTILYLILSQILQLLPVLQQQIL